MRFTSLMSELPLKKRMCLQNSGVEEETLDLTERNQLDETEAVADEELFPPADVSTKENLEDYPIVDQELPMDLTFIRLSLDSSHLGRSGFSCCSFHDDMIHKTPKKGVTKKFKPPTQNNSLDNEKELVSKKSRIEANMISKKKTSSSNSPQDKTYKKTVKSNLTSTQHSNKNSINSHTKLFTSADSSSEIVLNQTKSPLPESNESISTAEDMTTTIAEPSESLLKAVTSTICADSDDSSREVSSSADFAENTSNFLASPAKKCSPQLSPMKKVNLQLSPAKNIHHWASPFKKSSPRTSPTKKSQVVKSTRSLTNAEYEEIFSAAINKIGEIFHQPSNFLASPAKKCSPQLSPMKKVNLQLSPAKNIHHQTSPLKKSSPRTSPTKKSQVVKSTRSLTNAEYEEIFSAAINVESVSEDVTAVLKSETQQCADIMNISEKTNVSVANDSDKENNTPKKKSKSNTTTPQNSQKNVVTCSPWGHHYAKQSQDSLHKELEGTVNTVENEVEEDSQTTNFSQVSNISHQSVNNRKQKKLIAASPKACVEHSPWGHHYSKMRRNSQSSSIQEREDTEQDEDKAQSEDMIANITITGVMSLSLEVAETTQLLQRRISSLSEESIVTHRERLQWLHEQRNVGVWVQCMNSTCKAFRYLKNISDPLEVPATWYCKYHPDVNYQTCGKNVTQIEQKEDEYLIETSYNCGSIVWAKLGNFPWWPAMVDDDPDLELYCWLERGSETPTYYNVVFFDSNPATRAWIPLKWLHKYALYENYSKFTKKGVRKELRTRYFEAKKQAADALTMPLLERLLKYSFIARYTGPINEPLLKEQEEDMKNKKINNMKRKRKHS